MDLKTRVNADLKDAMRARDKVRLNTIRALRGEILKFEKSGQAQDIADDDILKMVKSLSKRRKDAIEQFTKGDRKDLADKERAELEILREYLPAQLSEAEMAELVKAAIQTVGAETMKDMGKVMGLLQGKVKATGKDADNSILAGLVKAALQ